MKYQSDDLARFPSQIIYGIENYTSPSVNLSDYSNIILSGLGGSGIAGRITKSFLFAVCPIPVEVVSDYNLPIYADKKTLAIMCSYSGNTEETLAMYAEAKAKGCKIICITTGGTLADLATTDKNKIYFAENGFQPRMALGYSLTTLLLLFGELTEKNKKEELSSVAVALANTPVYVEEGRKIFEPIRDYFPAKNIVVTDNFCYPLGVRFCQQLQENAKMEAFIHELPEANHNVIETYYGKMDSVFYFINSHQNKRTHLRFEYLKNILTKSGNHIVEMSVNPDSLLSMMETIYILDWVSLLLADFRGVNSAAIHNINGLKEFLSTH